MTNGPNNFYFNKVFLQQTVHHLMSNQKLLQLQNKSVELPPLGFSKSGATIWFVQNPNAVDSIVDFITIGCFSFPLENTQI
jgi:hypothetical protein